MAGDAHAGSEPMGWPNGEVPSVLNVLAALDADGKLNLHYHGARIFSSLGNLDAAIAEVQAWQEEFGGPHVRVDTLKLFLDATNGSGGILNVVNGVGGSSTAANPDVPVTVVSYP